MGTTQIRNEILELWLSRSAMRTLQAAARTSGRSVDEYVLQSALARAEEILQERQCSSLDSEQWVAFRAALEAPTPPASRLVRLLKEPSVFERRGE